MEEQKVPVPNEVFATFQFLKPEYERMQQSMEMLESKREEDVATWNGTVDAEIKEFGDRVKEMRAKAENPADSRGYGKPGNNPGGGAAPARRGGAARGVGKRSAALSECLWRKPDALPRAR